MRNPWELPMRTIFPFTCEGLPGRGNGRPQPGRRMSEGGSGVSDDQNRQRSGPGSSPALATVPKRGSS
jgi:hypothetical protein